MRSGKVSPGAHDSGYESGTVIRQKKNSGELMLMKKQKSPSLNINTRCVQ